MAKLLKGHIAGNTGRIQEAFINRIDLLTWGHFAEDRHHPLTHIAVKRVVRAEDNDSTLTKIALILEQGIAHFDAHRFRLRATGDHAPVVVRNHDKRLSAQIGAEYGFARCVKIVCVSEREHKG